MIPTGKRQAVLETLDEQGIDYVVADETSSREFTAIVTFPLPTGAVEDVLAALREVGIDESTYTVIVEAETVISRNFEQLQERYEKSDGNDETIAREELQSKASGLVSGTGTYVVMTIVSSVIATAGLLLDSAATVVGSMVIAPLIGPAMAASVGTVVNDEEMFRKGVKLQILGIALAIGSAAVFAAALRFGNLVPPGLDPLELAQVAERLAPNVLVLAIALGAGVAGILSLMTGVSAALVGVMIAVALIPPAAATGIGIAYVIPELAAGSFVFVAVNTLSINLAALAVLWYSGYRPEQWFYAESVRATMIKRAVVLAVGILLLTIVLGGVTYDTYVGSVDEQRIHAEVLEELDDPQYEEARLVELQVTRGDGTYPRHPATVTVTIAVSSQDPPPGLADRLADRIERATGYSVNVEVRYLRTDQSG